ncbi:helix-turn-helix domain-containing protein [Escherichia ruysiae]|uniref:helix-turn-helix domain-containing protein n=1 Tax=Escherichia ruysiae TaxID=2608867 RepID=UPI001919C5E5
MNSRVACTKFDLPINTNLDNNHTLTLKRIRFYNSAVIFIRNAQLVIKATDGDVIDISPGSLCYIEKNLVIDATLKVLGSGVLYDIYTIDSDILSSVCKVMEPILSGQRLVTQVRKRIFFYKLEETDKEIFRRLMSDDLPPYRQVYKIAYLLSRIHEIEPLAYSLSVSTDITFTEKLKKIIEADLSRGWKLSDLRDILHMSEVSIRKKLERENNNFNALVLDIRMQHAAKMITSTEKHINRISYDVGYTSTSYFIRNFKNYFGITPKQFSLKVKRKV